MEWKLNPVEARILGVLIEKEMATPDYYPLTLNALINACNQKTNREPVMNLDEPAVSEALASLRNQRLVLQVKAQGSRALKYEHTLKEAAGVAGRELALICMLLLRGPQTAGELRSRTTRLAEFTGLPAVEHSLRKLAEHEKGPFVAQLPRRPGHKENRFTHLFNGEESSLSAEMTEPAVAPAGEEPDTDSNTGRLELLEQEVADLRTELDELRAQFMELKQSFE